MSDESGRLPVLWQIPRSIFVEKVRFALDYKGIPYRTVTLPAGVHRAILPLVRRGTTVPALDLDGRRLCGSSAIVAALERRYPDPPLYPGDPQQLREALELERYFDAVGHDVRRVVVAPVLNHPEATIRFFFSRWPALAQRLARSGYPLLERAVRRTYDIRPETVVRARSRVLAAFDRVEASLGTSRYLVGDAFTVADLAGASLLAPLTAPDEYPGRPSRRAVLPLPTVRLRGELRRRRGGKWTLEIYRRHRGGPGVDSA